MLAGDRSSQCGMTKLSGFGRIRLPNQHGENRCLGVSPALRYISLAQRTDMTTRMGGKDDKHSSTPFVGQWRDGF